MKISTMSISIKAHSQANRECIEINHNKRNINFAIFYNNATSNEVLNNSIMGIELNIDMRFIYFSQKEIKLQNIGCHMKEILINKNQLKTASQTTISMGLNTIESKLESKLESKQLRMSNIKKNKQ